MRLGQVEQQSSNGIESKKIIYRNLCRLQLHLNQGYSLLYIYKNIKREKNQIQIQWSIGNNHRSSSSDENYLRAFSFDPNPEPDFIFFLLLLTHPIFLLTYLARTKEEKREQNRSKTILGNTLNRSSKAAAAAAGTHKEKKKEQLNWLREKRISPRYWNEGWCLGEKKRNWAWQHQFVLSHN